MNIEELKQAIEEVTIGLYDKDELLNLIQEACILQPQSVTKCNAKV